MPDTDHLDHLLGVLRCPACLERLERVGAAKLACHLCGTEYPATSDRFDLRPRARLVRSMELEILPPDSRALPPLPQPLATGPYPAIPLDPANWSLN